MSGIPQVSESDLLLFTIYVDDEVQQLESR